MCAEEEKHSEVIGAGAQESQEHLHRGEGTAEMTLSQLLLRDCPVAPTL